MSRILVPSSGPQDWQRLLAKPDLHWRAGRSAMSAALSWETAVNGPSEVVAILEQAFGPVQLLLATPEHKTPLPGGTRDSQTDVLALYRATSGLVVVGVEAKVEEPFGPLVGEWRIDASPGKRERLAYICDLLGIAGANTDDVHYQLLHRTAAAVVEARRFASAAAAMIVQSFSETDRWFDAFELFARRIGAQDCVKGAPIHLQTSSIPLVLGWASSPAQVPR